MTLPAALKPVQWMGDSLVRVRVFPEPVQSVIGYAIYLAQLGEKHTDARPMKGINAVEVISDFDGDAFRGVYTTKFKGQLYVLHCFQKKSKKGIKTPKPDIDLIKKRLQDAEKHHKRLEKERARHGKENESRTRDG